MTINGRWRIYYSDGATVDDQLDNPPCRGVEVIVQRHPDIGWHTMCKYDYYVWWDNRWQGVDEIGLYDLLEELGMIRPSIGDVHTVKVSGEWKDVSGMGFYAWLKELGFVLLGRTMTQKKFNAVMKRALEDMDAEKTGWTRDEGQLDG